MISLEPTMNDIILSITKNRTKMLNEKPSSEFQKKISEIVNNWPSPQENHTTRLVYANIETELGPMIAISDEDTLHLLEFIDRQGLERELNNLHIHTKGILVSGDTPPLTSIKKELHDYFQGKLKTFKTPIRLMGSPFQNKVWQALIDIPYGETRSYKDQAQSIGNATAFRAVANANGCNQLAIIVPCHRIIRTNGDLGGYGGGTDRKKWLIEHEKANN